MKFGWGDKYIEDLVVRELPVVFFMGGEVCFDHCVDEFFGDFVLCALV